MTEEFKKLNEKYNDDTYPIFPYVSKERITPLQAGLYRKNKAKFRGITALYNRDTEQYEFPLYGIYNVEEDLVIVPETMVMTPKKQQFLDTLLKAGFKQVPTTPKFTPVQFAPESIEARLALMNKLEFQDNMHGASSNTIQKESYEDLINRAL